MTDTTTAATPLGEPGDAETVESLRAALDSVYTERAQLLALLTTRFPAALYPAPDLAQDAVPSPEDWTILRLQIGGKWCTWHISPKDRELFHGVPVTDGTDPDDAWDGHTTEQKYAFIGDHVAASDRIIRAQAVHHAAVATAYAAARNLAAISPETLADPENASVVQMLTNGLGGVESVSSALSMPSRYGNFDGVDLTAMLSPPMLRLGRAQFFGAYRAALRHGPDDCPHGPQDAPSDADQTAAGA